MMLLDKPLFAACAIGYFVLMLGIGIAAARRTRTAKDYFIAGRQLGLWVTGLGMMSAAFSGFVFLGGPGYTYSQGISTLLICMPVSITAALLCWSVGKRLWLMSAVRPIYTVPEAIEARYDSRLAKALAALAILIGSVAYLGAQFKALALLLDAIFGGSSANGESSLWLAMGLGVGVVLLYSVFGGMIAGAYTDLVQGVLMCVAAVGVAFYALKSGGGITNIMQSIVDSQRFSEEFLDPFGSTSIYTAMGFFLVFSVGVLGQPHMLHKFYMLKDPRTLRWLPVVLAGSQSLCVLLWFLLGVTVPALVAQGKLAPLAQPDQATPTFLLQFTPDLLGGLVFAGVIAAIMSTADSFLNVASAALVRDLPRSLGKPLRNELNFARVAVVAIALIAMVSSMAYGSLIAKLGTFAFGTFAAALAPALAIGLNATWVTRRAAVASIAVGATLSVLFETLSRFDLGWSSLPLPTGSLPSVVALTTSLLTLCLISRLPEKRNALSSRADIAAIIRR